MPDKSKPESDTTFRAVQAFNNSGFGFQGAVLQEFNRLYTAGDRDWVFTVEEYPVVVQAKTARIDFILKHARCDRFIVAECKRVGSGRGWAFARSSFVRYDYDPSEVIVDAIVRDGGRNTRRKHANYSATNKVYHQGSQFESSEFGKALGTNDRETIHNACTQVLTGANGFLNRLAGVNSLWTDGVAVLIPAIFTTAPLFVLDHDLSDADLHSGNLPADTKVTPVKWLWLRQHASPLIVSEIEIAESEHQTRLGNSLGRQLDNEYARTTAIISPAGMKEFLSSVSGAF